MTRILTRASVLGIKKETKPGTFEEPTAATDYMALQPDFSIDPSTEELTNDEIKNSLANSKSIQGLESPSGSGSHYFRASGTEGTAPDYALILESSFGSQVDVATERDTVAGSDLDTLNHDVGEGVEFPRGRPVLIKDAANGYSVRFVESTTGDASELNFVLSNSPPTGTPTGRPNYWVPVNTGHPSLSLAHYLGNGGGLMAMAGGKTTSYNLSYSAGQLINMSFTVEGTWFGFDPYKIDSDNNFIDFNIGGGELNVSIPEMVYKHPKQLADAVQEAMNSVSADAITVRYNHVGTNEGRFTISTAGASLELLFDGGNNSSSSIFEALGFELDDYSGQTSYTSVNQVSRAAPQVPQYDTNTDPVAAKSGTIRLGDKENNICFEADTVEWTMNTPATAINAICSSTGRSETVINSRETEVTVTASLKQFDAEVFEKYIENTETSFMIVTGNKSGANWIPGTVTAGWLPKATVTAASVEDNDGIVFVNFTLKAFSDSEGNEEVYLGTL